jgi:hypothetical protein
MKLSKPLMHLRLHQLQYYYWDPRIDPREPEYDPDFDPKKPDGGVDINTPFFYANCYN